MDVTLPSIARQHARRAFAQARIAFPLMLRDQWIARFAELAQVAPPSPEQIDALLALAGTAAHASQRTAAPLACWIAGRSPLPLAQLGELAGAVGGDTPAALDGEAPAAG
jgi:hypothetical protein